MVRFALDLPGGFSRSSTAAYGLVDFLLFATAIAAPAPPPAITATIATLAPVDIPPPPVLPAGAGALEPAPAAGAPARGTSVCACKFDAATRQPPCDLGESAVTFMALVAIVTTGRAADAVPVTSTRLPTLAARS